VSGSVLSPGVVVEAGASVVDSVRLPGVVVRKGATVRHAILDDGVVAGTDTSVGGSDGEVALVGRAAELPAGVAVPRGTVARGRVGVSARVGVPTERDR
jgi:glucose-1-phosphate adenylyltransferase